MKTEATLLSTLRFRAPLASVLLLIACFACSDSEPRESAFNAPSVSAGEDGWELYSGATQYDASNVRSLNPTLGPPEAAVVKFLASQLRGDSVWQKALVPRATQSSRLERQLDQWNTWELQSFALRGRKESGGGLWIRVRFDIQYEGKSDGGEDEFEVAEVDGIWLVRSVPS